MVACIHIRYTYIAKDPLAATIVRNVTYTRSMSTMSRDDDDALACMWAVVLAVREAFVGRDNALLPPPPPADKPPADLIGPTIGVTAERMQTFLRTELDGLHALMLVSRTPPWTIGPSGTHRVGPARNMMTITHRQGNAGVTPPVPIETAEYRRQMLTIDSSNPRAPPPCCNGPDCLVYSIQLANKPETSRYPQSNPPLPTHVPPAMLAAGTPVVARGKCLLCETYELPLLMTMPGFRPAWRNDPDEYRETVDDMKVLQSLGPEGWFYVRPILSHMRVCPDDRSANAVFVSEHALRSDFRRGHRDEKGIHDARAMPYESSSVGAMCATVVDGLNKSTGHHGQREAIDTRRLTAPLVMFRRTTRDFRSLLQWRLDVLETLLIRVNFMPWGTTVWCLGTWYDMNLAALDAIRDIETAEAQLPVLYDRNAMIAPDAQPTPSDPTPVYVDRVVADLVAGTSNTGAAVMLRQLAAKREPVAAPDDALPMVRAYLVKQPTYRLAKHRKFDRLKETLAAMHSDIARSHSRMTRRADAMLVAGIIMRHASRFPELEAVFRDFDQLFRRPIIEMAPTELLPVGRAKLFHTRLATNRALAHAGQLVPRNPLDKSTSSSPPLVSSVLITWPFVHSAEVPLALTPPQHAAWRYIRARLRIIRRWQPLPPLLTLPPPGATSLPVCLACVRVVSGDDFLLPGNRGWPFCQRCRLNAVRLVDLTAYNVVDVAAGKTYALCIECGHIVSGSVALCEKCTNARHRRHVQTGTLCFIGDHLIRQWHQTVGTNTAIAMADNSICTVCAVHLRTYRQWCVDGLPKSAFH